VIDIWANWYKPETYLRQSLCPWRQDLGTGAKHRGGQWDDEMVQPLMSSLAHSAVTVQVVVPVASSGWSEASLVTES
jgi:hypothetical protein